jgi:hypothetical protein
MSGGKVKHWLHENCEYNELVDKETICADCLHSKVCDRDVNKRCANFWFGDSSKLGCDSCTHHFSRFDERQPIPCFYCADFLLRGE